MSLPGGACGEAWVGFSLTKWYLDVVTEDGRLAIAYWAEVRWKSIHQTLCGLLLHGGTTADPWRFSGRAVPAPTPDEGGLHWSAEPLRLTVEVSRREPSFRQRLLETKDGVLDWCCEIPRADVRLQAGDAVLEGLGYAERLDLGVPPWRMPADEIRWGRFLSARTSVVWIDWRGIVSRHLVFQDGSPMAPAAISDDQIQFGSGSRLALRERRSVSDERLGGLLAPLEALGSLVAPIARVHQTRWLSRGTLHGTASAIEHGWALHERVRRG